MKINGSTWDYYWGKDKVSSRSIDGMSRMIFSNIERHVSFERKCVLELGCGKGRLGYRALIKGAREVTFVDSSARALHLAKDLTADFSNTTFIQADLFEMVLRKKYEIVLSSGLVEHFDREKKVECVRIHKELSKDKVVIVVPASFHYNNIRMRLGKTRENFGWQKPIGKLEMVNLFKQVELTPCVMERFYTLYPFLGGPSALVKNVANGFFNIGEKWCGGLLIAIGRV